jgi:hypothetical protein
VIQRDRETKIQKEKEIERERERPPCAQTKMPVLIQVQTNISSNLIAHRPAMRSLSPFLSLLLFLSDREAERTSEKKERVKNGKRSRT